MPRQKKDNKALNIKIDSKLYNHLEKYCEKTRLTKTALVELALEDYLKKRK